MCGANTRGTAVYDGFFSQTPRARLGTRGSNLDAHLIARCDQGAHAVEFSKTAARSRGGDSSWNLRFNEAPRRLADRTGQYSAPRCPWKGSGRGAGTGAAGSIDRSPGRTPLRAPPPV